jgi:crossover junction endodeoxyribonuclease RuvC
MATRRPREGNADAPARRVATSGYEIMVGIDQSLTGTAVCCLDETGRIVSANYIKPKHGPSEPIERLIEIESRIMDALPCHPTLMFMEGYAYGKTKQAHQMGELGGVLKVAFLRARIPCYQVAPNTLKKFITGSGAGDKTPMIAAIAKKYGHVFDKDDQYDAFGLSEMARMFRAVQVEDKELPAYQREALFTVYESAGVPVPDTLITKKKRRGRK